MNASTTMKTLKSSIRKNMRGKRRAYAAQNPSPNLYQYFEDSLHSGLNTTVIAGFAPIGNEIDIWPLLTSLHQNNRHIALPVVVGSQQPLTFRAWTPNCEMETDRYGISFPASGSASGKTLTPKLVLVPLLAFTPYGERLGYGGGYYDRTLEALRRDGEVFACGVAYAGQEVPELPTDAHDAKLDGILTENGFRTFR